MFTHTIYVDLEKLSRAGRSEASLILRMMMACNDIALANHYQDKAKDDFKGKQKHIERGARLYFARLQAGHLNEAILLIKELDEILPKSLSLRATLEKCSPENKEHFLTLKACLKDGAKHEDFKQVVFMLRNKVAFHYTANKLFEQAISDSNNHIFGKDSSITVSDDINYFRFNIADQVIDTVVCRNIWTIDHNSNVQDEADKKSIFCYEMCKALVFFCSELAYLYIQEHGTK